ncbi:MAG: hypothetical protein QOG69_954, partial [Actinomycetota bacterium]|nr:hypothetical protein [Actinomycetota bacterium]
MPVSAERKLKNSSVLTEATPKWAAG